MTKHLDLRFETLAFKALDKGEPNGSYEAVVAAFGNVDRHREVLVSGALDETLAEALPPVVYSHDWMTPPIGTTSEMAEISRGEVERLTGKSVPEDVVGGLYAKASLFVDDVPLANHVYTALKNTNGDGSPALREHSVGLNVIKESFEKRGSDGMLVVLLEKAECVEHGPCIKGINPATNQIATKAADIRRLIAKGVLNADEVRAALDLSPSSLIDLKRALPVSNLDFAARGHTFDSDGARSRVKTWASDEDGNVDLTKYAKAFLWVDDGDGAASNLTSYRFVVADVVGDNLKYIPKGIFAAAGVLNGARGGTTISKEGQATLKKSVDTLYARMRKQFDDDTIVTNWKASSSPAERQQLADLLFA